MTMSSVLHASGGHAKCLFRTLHRRAEMVGGNLFSRDLLLPTSTPLSRVRNMAVFAIPAVSILDPI
jgi:hypothetical protein